MSVTSLRKGITHIGTILRVTDDGNSPEDLANELNTQETLLMSQETTIDDIAKALVGKSAGSGEGGITPIGTLDISENGVYDVTSYANANVNVEAETIIPDGYIKPSGSFNITSDGTYNVTQYASVNVDTPDKKEEQTKSVTITSNGTQTVTPDSNKVLSSVSITTNVPIPDGYIQPTGELEITENGTYNVTNYASAEVNIESAGSDTTIEDALVTRSLSGAYVNNRVTSIGTEGLRATQISSLHCENVTTVGGEAVRQCNYLVSVYLPKCTNLSGYSFGICPLLERVELGPMTNIRAYDFYNCPNLTTLIINNTTKVCTLANVNAFTSSGIASGTGYIYVPDDLVDSYKTATNWSTYANQIKGLSELEV